MILTNIKVKCEICGVKWDILKSHYDAWDKQGQLVCEKCFEELKLRHKEEDNGILK